MNKNNDGQRSGVRGLQGALDRLFESMADWSARRAKTVMLGALALLAVGLWGAAKVRQDNSMDSYFNESDAAFAAYQQYIRDFSSDEVVYLLYRAPGREHGPFDIEVMRQIDALTRALEAEVPFARKVTSLSNVEFIEADGDLITIRDLIEDFPETQDELLRLREVALGKPIYVGSLLSPDARNAAIVIEMTRTSTDPVDRLRHDPDGGDGIANLYPQVPNRVVREILERPEFRCAGIEYLISGDVPMNAAYNEILGGEIGLLTVVSMLLVSLAGLLLFRTRLLGLLAPLGVVLLSIALTLGLMGLVGWKVNLFFLMIPSLLCAVGVAQCVHVLHAWQDARAEGLDAPAAVRVAVSRVGTPCLLAAVTTAIGFLGMTVSDLRAVSELALYSAFGVVCAFVLSLTLLIGFAARAKQQPAAVGSANSGWLQRFIEWTVAINLRHPRALLAGFLVVLLGAGTGLARLQVDFNFLHEFKPSQEWRRHTEQINALMGGLLSVIYLFETDTADGIKNPDLLKEIEALQAAADRETVVQDSLSIVDIVKELNQAFHGDDPAYYRIPDDPQVLAQLLLVYEMSGGKEMEDVLNLDRSSTALQVRLQLVAASEVRRFMAAMDAHLAQHPPQHARIEVSGIGLLWVRMADYITKTQIEGYAVVFGLITLVMMLAFGSVKVGLIGMIPNLFPIALTLGMMGWLAWPLDYLRLLLATIAIGIAVDDTIHMLARLRSEFAASGDYRTAVARALRGVGPAITVTTVILTAAFSSYLISSMAVLSSFGALLAATMVAALVADLFLLPALVLWLRPFGPERMPGGAVEAAPYSAAAAVSAANNDSASA